MRAGGLGLGVGRARGRIAAGFSVTWRAGFAGGIIAPETATSTVLADLTASASMGTTTFSELADPSTLFTVTGTTLVLSAAISPSASTSVTVRGTGTAKTVDKVIAVSAYPALAAPANAGGGALPVISGTAAVGQTLSASTGTWTGFPNPSFAYQWKADGTNISGATAATYLLTSSEYNKVITVTVTATNSQGSASATSAATSAVVAVPTGNARIFVFAGQSNMDNASGAQPRYATLNPNIKIWFSGAWQTYDPATNASHQTAGQWGPEAEFLYQYATAHPSETVYVVKQATGGTSLAVDWAQGGSGPQWEALKSKFNAAKANLVAAGKTVSAPVLSWMQGEYDSGNSDYAGAYQTNLTTFFASVRTLMGAGIKIVVGRVADTVTTGSQRSLVRAAQLAVVNADGNAAIVSTDALIMNVDDLHFSTPSVTTLGLYFYQGYAGTYNAAPTGLSIAWAAGYESGIIPQNVPAGTVIASLSASAGDVGGAVSYAEVSDPSGVITVSSTNLQAATGFVNGGSYSATVKATSNLNVATNLGLSLTGGPDGSYANGGGGSGNRVSDTLTQTPIVAYSTRKVRGAYTGYAMKVRRSSDNTTQDIGFNSDGTLNTTALLAFVGAGSGFVDTWYDQSASIRHVTQATTSLQPRIVNAGTVDVKNGHPAVYFGGAHWLKETSGSYVAADFVLTMALNGATFVGYDGWVGSPNDDGVMGTAGALDWFSSQYSGGHANNVASGAAIGSGTLYAQRMTAGSGLTLTGGVQIGRSNGNARYANGWMADVFAFSTLMSSGDRTTLYNDQVTQFGVG